MKIAWCRRVVTALVGVVFLLPLPALGKGDSGKLKFRAEALPLPNQTDVTAIANRAVVKAMAVTSV